MSQSDTDTSSETDDSTFTDATDIRIKWLGSLMAAITMLSYIALLHAVSFGFATFSPIPTEPLLVYALLVLAAGTWTFGIDLIDKYTGG